MKLDPKLLAQLEINLSENDLKSLNEHFFETLDQRVGLAIVELLNDQQAEEFLKISENGDASEMDTWLKTNVADYKDVIQDEYDILLGELARDNRL